MSLGFVFWIVEDWIVWVNLNSVCDRILVDL